MAPMEPFFLDFALWKGAACPALANRLTITPEPTVNPWRTKASTCPDRVVRNIRKPARCKGVDFDVFDSSGLDVLAQPQDHVTAWFPDEDRAASRPSQQGWPRTHVYSPTHAVLR
eukprot:scaffold2927_cov408-Prasinococcus_capsulatus_cf.AAC.12